MKPQIPTHIHQKQNVFFVIIGVILVGMGIWQYTQNADPAPQTFTSSSTENNGSSEKSASSEKKNANALSLDGWASLGFSYKQAQTILNYKNSLGGNFDNIEELSRCFVISPEKLEEIKDHLFFSPTSIDQKPNRRFSDSKRDYFSYNNSDAKTGLHTPSSFDPNTVSEAQWVAYGLSPAQAHSLMKYKRLEGGHFKDKHTFLKAYVLSPENKIYLEDRIQIQNSFTKQPVTSTSEIAQKNIADFDPNSLAIHEWMALGFSEKQSQSILKYKSTLPNGRFHQAEDLQKSFVISEKMFARLAPHLKFPINTPVRQPAKSSESITTTSTDFSKIDINAITFSQLREFGFDEKSAASVLGFRKKLGGFMSRSQITETYGIDQVLAAKLSKTLSIDNSRVKTYPITIAPENWLRNHPYFRYYADKIIFIRNSEQKPDKILKFTGANQEAIRKMKLYLNND